LTNLSELSISKNDMKTIVEALRQSKTIKEIDLEQNGINDEIAAEMGEMLKINKTLMKLKLFMNSITSVGDKHIALALQVDVSLFHLDLRRNRICIEGATAMLEMLQEWNATMGKLYLKRHNSLEFKSTHHEIYKIVLLNQRFT
jgi:Ran GTPase-activating protein (RanGAP) involved in mRNA processing and transport